MAEQRSHDISNRYGNRRCTHTRHRHHDADLYVTGGLCDHRAGDSAGVAGTDNGHPGYLPDLYDGIGGEQHRWSLEQQQYDSSACGPDGSSNR